MCGIAGVYGFDDPAGLDPDVLTAMTDALVHRGPDAHTTCQTGAFTAGFRRLSLVDLAGGGQPHATPDSSVVSVCNGEIFNHRELREELRRKGHAFRSGSDTEVLVHLYEEYGTELTDHLDGQFAFALYDRREDRLVLARDHCGVLPLFYTEVAGRIVFASEVKSILRHPLVERRVDLRGLDQVLSLPGLVSPRTMFEGIRSLRPGERLVADRSGHRTERYWDLDYPLWDDEARHRDAAALRDPRVLDTCADRTRDLLEVAVRSRSVADVPVGSYLSGGLDSSLIGALLAAGRPGHAWPSYAVTFPGSSIDEARYQRLVAGKIGTRHHEVPVDAADTAGLLGAMVRHAETPVKESYNVCSMLLAREVRATGTVAVLSGEGADELFGGYPGYLFDTGGPGRGPADLLEEQLERAAAHRMWGLDLRYETDQVPAHDLRRQLYSGPLAEEFDAFSVTSQRLVDPERLIGRHPLHQRSYLDFHLRLADHLLGDHGDRMAMASSVEMRFPFLARDVVRHATTIPPSLMTAGGREKAVLRRAAEGLVPQEVLDRRKFGFRSQTSTELLLAGDEWFDDLLSPATVRRQGYFDPAVVAELIRRQTSGARTVHPHLDTDYLLVIATFAIFLEEFGLPCLG